MEFVAQRTSSDLHTITSDARGFRRVRKGVQRIYFIAFGEHFEGFELNKKFQKSGELGLHKTLCQSFSDDDDEFYDDDVLQERCERASRGSLEAL